MRARHLVETFVGWDRPTLMISREWLEWRVDFFNRYTLASLLNQSDQDFDILIECGLRHYDYLRSLSWHPRCIVAFDHGRSYYSKLDADFISITRIDSDDLFRRSAMETVKQHFIAPKKSDREALVFSQRIVWDQVNRFIIDVHERNSSPFFTHIFARELLANPKLFEKRHFLSHGSGGAGDRAAHHLPGCHVCVIKHGKNISYLKRGQFWPLLSEEQRAHFEKQGYPVKLRHETTEGRAKIFIDRNRIIEILSEYGIREEAIP